MPDIIALDIVILPPEDIMDEIVGINRELLSQYPSDLRLNKTDCLPHITLMQAVFKRTDLPEINRTLEEIAKNTSSFDLAGSIGPFNERIVSLQIESNRQIQDLHQAVMENLKTLSLSVKVETGQFYGTNIASSALAYVENFSQLYAYDKFNPHVTLGHGQAVKDKRRFSFKAERLAICQLGAHNTCAKLLFETHCG